MTERSVYDLHGQNVGDEIVSVVWIIDAEQWPRALLRAELIERGYDAVGYEKADDASPARFPDVIVAGLRDLTRDEVAKLFTLGVPVIGVASIPEPEWLREFKWGALLRRPISIGELADVVASCDVSGRCSLKKVVHPGDFGDSESP